MSVEAVLQGLHKLRKTGPSAWSACCPAHEDRSPSLAIKETADGRVLLHCFGGCGVDAVLVALGLGMDALFPPRQGVGEGAARLRRPWAAGDLLRLAAYESTVAFLVAADVSAGKDVSAGDRARMAEAVARLGDVARAVNG